MKFMLVICGILALLCASVLAADKSVCSLAKEIGTCRQPNPRFFYNSAAKKCEEFLYGPCDANGNRFDTKEECEQTCL